MTRAFITLLVLALSGSSAWAQHGRLTGTVQTTDAEPLPGVNVRLDGTPLGTATDERGRFELTVVPEGTYTLVASAIGFRTTQQTVTVTSEATTRVTLVLAPTVLSTEEVVVTAARRAQAPAAVPVSLSVLPARELEARNVVALDDALRYVPGVQLQGNQVAIRGSSGYAYNTGSRVLLLLDGAPLLTPDSDGLPFDVLPMDRVERVEVLKGPGSALYGSGALGGVVQLITKDAPETPKTAVRLHGGAYEPVRHAAWRARWSEAGRARFYGGASVSHARRVGERLGGWVHLSYRRDEGYTRLSEEQHVLGFAKVEGRITSGLRAELLTGYLRRRVNNFLFWNGAGDPLNPGTLAIGDQRSPSGANDNLTTQISVLPALTHVVTPSFYYTLRTRLFAVGIRPIDGRGRPRSLADGTLGFRYGGEVQATWTPARQQFLTVGASVDANTTESSFFVSSDGDAIGRQPETALFGQWEQPLGPVTATVGLRYDAYRIDRDDTVTQVSPKLNLIWAVRDDLAVRLAAGRGFRVPSLAERFTDNRDFFPILRNLDLRPESSESLETGVRLVQTASHTAWSLDVAAFWNVYDGLIEPTFVRTTAVSGGTDIGFQFVNVTEARIRGVEAVLEAAAPVGSARLGYTFLDATDLGTDEPLAFRARHLLLLALDASPWPRLTLGADLRWASEPERVDSDFALFVPDAETLLPTRVLDLRAGAETPYGRLTLLVENALDYYYLDRPALLAPPRHVTLRWALDL